MERSGVVDLETAEEQLNGLVDKRAKGRQEANATEVAWKASVRRHHEKLRGQRRWGWFRHYSALADSLRKSADEYEAKAQALLEDEPSKGGKHAEET
jgi:hypothetical protein